MVQLSSEAIAETIAVISRELDVLRYELETVKDMEEAVRIARRLEERFASLAGHFETAETRRVSC